MPVINLSLPCLRNVFELLKLETISNIGYYTPFYDNFTKDQLLNQMKMYITDKVYDTRYGDLVPLVTSNALNIGIVIIEKMANGQHDVRIVQPRQNIISNTSLIYVYKCGDHYDACLQSDKIFRGHQEKLFTSSGENWNWNQSKRLHWPVFPTGQGKLFWWEPKSYAIKICTSSCQYQSKNCPFEYQKSLS